MMERYPDYVFGASQPQQYEWTKQHYPSVYRQIVQRVRQGRWDIQGGMWVEADTNLAGGEALVRQMPGSAKGVMFITVEDTLVAATMLAPGLLDWRGVARVMSENPARIVGELDTHGGTRLATRFDLAVKAFEHTAAIIRASAPSPTRHRRYRPNRPHRPLPRHRRPPSSPSAAR